MACTAGRIAFCEVCSVRGTCMQGCMFRERYTVERTTAVYLEYMEVSVVARAHKNAWAAHSYVLLAVVIRYTFGRRGNVFGLLNTMSLHFRTSPLLYYGEKG